MSLYLVKRNLKFKFQLVLHAKIQMYMINALNAI